jgi:ABC-type nitrate/sulfonate/bicarbonate transport system substrate-binding protein
MERKPVRIGPSHYHVGHIVPAMVAKEMTYFEQEGLEDYALYQGGLIPAIAEKMALRRAMTEKSVHIAPDVKPSAAFALAAAGEDVHIVGCWRNRQDFRWYGAKGLESFSDLKGKRIGIRDFGGIDHTSLKTALKRFGLDPDHDVTFVRGARFHPHEQPEMALREGEVDLINLTGEDSRGLTDEGFPVLLTSRDLYPRGRSDRVIIATGRMVDDDGDLLEAYLRATIRAYWFITDYAVSRPYLEALVRRLRQTCLDEEEAGRAGVEGGGRLTLPIDGAPGLLGLEDMVAEAKDHGDVDASFELAPMLRLEFVERAFAELQARPELQEQLSRVRGIYEARDAGREPAKS